MTNPAADPRLLVLYDADCGICTRSARLLRRLDGGHRLHLMPLEHAHGTGDAPPMEALLEAIHVRNRDGYWSSAGSAWVVLAGEVPLLRPMAIAVRVPGISRLVDSVYALVARNRHRLSRLVGDQACEVGSKTP